MYLNDVGQSLISARLRGMSFAIYYSSPKACSGCEEQGQPGSSSLEHVVVGLWNLTSSASSMAIHCMGRETAPGGWDQLGGRDFLSLGVLWLLSKPSALACPCFTSAGVSFVGSVPSSGLVLSGKAMKPHPKHGSSSHLLQPPA